MNAWNVENVFFEFQVALELAKIAIKKGRVYDLKIVFFCFCETVIFSM